MADDTYSLILKKNNAHDRAVYCCAWERTLQNTRVVPIIPPRDILVTSGLDRLIRVWQLRDDRLDLLFQLGGTSLPIVSLALSVDAYTLATCSMDSQCLIWDLEVGHLVNKVNMSPADGWKIALSSDNTKIISGSQTGDIHIYSVQNGLEQRVLDTRGKFILSIAWSHSGNHIACGAEDGRVTILDAEQGKVLHAIQEYGFIHTVCFSLDSKAILFTCGNRIKIYNVINGTQIGSDFVLPDDVLSAEFAPNGKFLAAGCCDGTVSIWKVAGQKCMHTFKEHSDDVCVVKYSPDGKMIASVSRDKSINIYKCPIVK